MKAAGSEYYKGERMLLLGLDPRLAFGRRGGPPLRPMAARAGP
jgi:hypothetical protein